MQIVLTEARADSSAPVDLSADPLGWLIRLRWLAFAAQALLLGLAWLALDLPFAFPRLAVLLGLLPLSNLGLTRLRRRYSSERTAGVVLLFDVGVLTLLLAQSGGPANPFSVFYLVHVAMAAALLEGPWALLLSVVTSLSFGLLFIITPETSMHVLHHGIGFALHLRGMLLAYGLAAIATGTFVARQARTLRARERQIQALEGQRARSERLRALHTLAAGAAHELGTPLATIALVAGELSRRKELTGEARSDAKLLLTEAERCHTILQRMAADAGAPLGEQPSSLDLQTLATTLREEFGERLTVTANTGAVFIPMSATLQSLRCLIQNALDATDEPQPGADNEAAAPTSKPIEVQIDHSTHGLEVAVTDHGHGIDAAILPRLGEPFFTTKKTGRGMGLGLFLTRALAEATGGELRIDSERGQGTTVSLRVGEVKP